MQKKKRTYEKMVREVLGPRRVAGSGEGGKQQPVRRAKQAKR